MAYIEVMEVTGSLSRRVLPFIVCACISYLSKMSNDSLLCLIINCGDIKRSRSDRNANLFLLFLGNPDSKFDKVRHKAAAQYY